MSKIHATEYVPTAGALLNDKVENRLKILLQLIYSGKKIEIRSSTTTRMAVSLKHSRLLYIKANVVCTHWKTYRMKQT